MSEEVRPASTAIPDNAFHKEAIRRVLLALSSHRVVACDGTALGIFRNNDLIRQDYDADFFTDASLRETIDSLSCAGISYRNFGDLWCQVWLPTGFHIDIFPAETLSKYTAVYKWDPAPYKYLSENDTVLRDVPGFGPVCLPTNLEEYLSIAYPIDGPKDYRREVVYKRKTDSTHHNGAVLPKYSTVHVSGTFDPLHQGHLRLIWKARMMGERVCCWVDSARVSRLNGKRPTQSETDRIGYLQGIADSVCIYSRDIGFPLPAGQALLYAADSEEAAAAYRARWFSALAPARCHWVYRDPSTSSTKIRMT